MSAVLMVRAGDHWSLRMSRHIAPDWEEMFGCLGGGAGADAQSLYRLFIMNMEHGWAISAVPHAPNLGDELHFGGLEWVGGWDLDVDLEDAFLVGGPVGTRDGAREVVEARAYGAVRGRKSER